jgi:hypothetical protein
MEIRLLDDEPTARSAPKGDPMDSRDLSRRAVKHWPIVREYLVDRSGGPTAPVAKLNPAHVPYDSNRGRPFGQPIPGPQLRELKGPSPYEQDGTVGSWVDVGTGAHGKDIVDLVAHLGQVDRKVAAAHLAEIVSRIVEVAA